MESRASSHFSSLDPVSGGNAVFGSKFSFSSADFKSFFFSRVKSDPDRVFDCWENIGGEKRLYNIVFEEEILQSPSFFWKDQVLLLFTTKLNTIYCSSRVNYASLISEIKGFTTALYTSFIS
jgi:hypothetical protein